jgi:ABC-type polysaccharide/polyol phosphate transport system ATPase subunit
MEERSCLNCNAPIEGRAGKKYCDNYCKSNFNYVKNKSKENSFFKDVDLQLKKNRRLLKGFNSAGKSTIREEKLLAAGFNPHFFTHYWKNRKGDVYLFCYEFGFNKRVENNQTKFVLVEWQSYMNIKMR